MVTANERLRRRRVRFLNWIKRGFVPQEAAFFVGQGFLINRATKQQKVILRALVARRASIIKRLKELNFTERDIFNYLTENVTQRFNGAEELIDQFSAAAGFESAQDRKDFVGEEAARSAALLFEVATDTDWSRDRLEQLNFRQWVKFRKVTGKQLGSRFPNFDN